MTKPPIPALRKGDDTMVWGIIGAMDTEIAMVRNRMDLEDIVEVYGSSFYRGRIYGIDVVLVCCHVGTVNAAIITSILIREFGASKVINVGIAGSTTTELHILDVVIADELVFHDADTEVLARYYPFRHSFPTDQYLRMLAVEAIHSLEDRSFHWKMGRIASGDVFVCDSGCKKQIMHRCNPLCIEMEGAAIAQVALMSRVPFLAIRSLTDNADEDTEDSYNCNLDQAAENATRVLLQMLAMSRQFKTTISMHT